MWTCPGASRPMRATAGTKRMSWTGAKVRPAQRAGGRLGPTAGGMRIGDGSMRLGLARHSSAQMCGMPRRRPLLQSCHTGRTPPQHPHIGRKICPWFADGSVSGMLKLYKSTQPELGPDVQVRPPGWPAGGQLGSWQIGSAVLSNDAASWPAASVRWAVSHMANHRLPTHSPPPCPLVSPAVAQAVR